MAVQIHQALLPAVRLELLPKSTLDIFITIIENDGIEGCIASGAVAASAALADAGVEMLGLVVSCAAVWLFELLPEVPNGARQSAIGEEIWLDPTEEEAQMASGSLILSGIPALGTVASVWQSGKLTPEETFEVSQALANAASKYPADTAVVHGGMSRTMCRHSLRSRTSVTGQCSGYMTKGYMFELVLP